MKKLSSLLLVLVMLFSVAAHAEQQTYEGTAKGFGGEVKVTVTLDGNKIVAVTAQGDHETPGIGEVAIEKIPALIQQLQKADVDALSGATVTSNAIEEALLMALTAAGVKPEDIQAAEVVEGEKQDQELTCDVVVIGAGGAGLAAALSAKEKGANVLVLEKMSYAGGNTLKATGGMNAAETSVQKTLGIEDSVQTFIDDTMKGGKNLNNPELVKKMAENSAAAIDWLASIGAPLPEVSFSGGATNKRIHRPEGGAAVGPYLVEKLHAQLEKVGIPLMLDTKASHILVENGKVVGVEAEQSGAKVTVHAKAVVLATGGFGANLAMCEQYNPALKGFVTTNAPCATGDGLVMAEEVGASLTDIEQIQIHPTVHQATSIMITESVRGGGAILVNKGGERFFNEMSTRDKVSAAVIAQEGSLAYLVFDQQQRENLSAIEKYVTNGLTVQADSVEELAKLIGCAPETLKKTVDTWNEAVKAKKDEAFGRDTGMDVSLEKGPFYAIEIAPGIHHTMGGVTINTMAQVLNKDGAAIEGFYAAGEVTGGVHGGNRIGGNAVADIIIFGREAGHNAADYAAK